MKMGFVFPPDMAGHVALLIELSSARGGLNFLCKQVAGTHKHMVEQSVDCRVALVRGAEHGADETGAAHTAHA